MITGHDGDDSEGLVQPLHSFMLSFTMIIFSEIGDKTFLVAALMAMKHDRLVVFSAALSALVAMTVLSAMLGHAVPTLIPKRMTTFLAAVLFFVFGARLLREGLAMSPDEGVSAEMQEVEMELAEKENLARKEGRRGSDMSPYALEMGLGNRKPRTKSRFPAPARSPSSSPEGRSPSPRPGGLVGVLSGLNNLVSLLLSPAWVQTFVMTFLGEWGDRSQIATIAMAAGQDYWWVTLGAVLGHACCTGVAVIGGRAIAGKVSLKVGKSTVLRHRRLNRIVTHTFQLLLVEPSRSSFLRFSTCLKRYPHRDEARNHGQGVWLCQLPTGDRGTYISVTTLVILRSHATRGTFFSKPWQSGGITGYMGTLLGAKLRTDSRACINYTRL